MNETSKPKRPYNSKRRQAQALETRRQILAAARRLFLERGYTGATIEAIAQEAGVAIETVFSTFGSKRGLLAELVDSSLDQKPGPLPPEAQPIPFLRRFAQEISANLEQVAPLFDLLRCAAKTEPEIAPLRDNLLAQRMQTMSAAIGRLRAMTPLREGIDETRAAETLWSLAGPELFNLMVGDRGWSREEYSQWLGQALVRMLLP